ncbi:WD40-repeat-containing domain protein [Dipodascopsis tothii]|uniref:WD40-repeat-containing domain protein n=1 Tax=Dipodascopsis tothii TaxID=44089 RepID=UPI0034CD7862
MDDQGQQPQRKAHRRTVDPGSPIGRYLAKRAGRSAATLTAAGALRPAKSYVIGLYPPAAYVERPVSGITGKLVHVSQNKIRHPINCVRWSPRDSGRRLLTASSSGEFTLWNGNSFNFETIMQAHEHAIRSLAWSYSGMFLLSGDQAAVVKYWQPNMNNVNVLHTGHRESVREVVFAPGDRKFATASDDGTLKVWDFNDAQEETTLTGHGWDVKCADWHPTKGLLVSGSKDNLVKLWDPRQPPAQACLATLHGHKNTVTKAAFQPMVGGGNLLATSSRDQTARVFDLRQMRDVYVLRGHAKDVTTLAWHPVHPELLVTGTHDGLINYFLLPSSSRAALARVPAGTPLAARTDAAGGAAATSATAAMSLTPARSIQAHDGAVWTLEFHPVGHVLCSGSNDKCIRFWCRDRPGASGTPEGYDGRGDDEDYDGQ